MVLVRFTMIFVLLACFESRPAAAEVSQLKTNGCTISSNHVIWGYGPETLETIITNGTLRFLEPIGETPLWVASCFSDTVQFRVGYANCAWGCGADLIHVIAKGNETAVLKKVSYRSNSSLYDHPGEKAHYEFMVELIPPESLQSILHAAEKAEKNGLWSKPYVQAAELLCADAETLHVEIAKQGHYRHLSFDVCQVPPEIDEFVRSLRIAAGETDVPRNSFVDLLEGMERMRVEPEKLRVRSIETRGQD